MDREFCSEIIFSLRKSKVRQIVLEYLVRTYPESSYASEIARGTGLRMNEVCGALNGSPNRYKEENCLVKLGLVKKEKRKNFCNYIVTDKGCRVWKLISR